MASPAATNFRQLSERIIGQFLQTIMVVDDQAEFGEKTSVTIPIRVASPGAPSFREKDTSGDSDQPEHSDEISFVRVQSEDEVEVESQTIKAHSLNAKKLIEDFATQRMVCAVIRPRDTLEVESLENTVYPLAESCDIVVFDWVLHGAADGAKVKELIGRITKMSSENEKRLRLIVVYTGQLELASITEQIRTALESLGQPNVVTTNAYTLEAGPVRIAVYAKGRVPGAQDNEELAARGVTIDDLPRKLISEFADMTMGLVSNVAIGSMAALRQNTHRLLTTFNPGLDAPFLAHRAMLKEPEDAGNLLVYLIGSELTAILDGSEIKKVAEDDHIRSWVTMKEGHGYEFAGRFSKFPAANIIENVTELLCKGVGAKDLKPTLTAYSKKPHTRDLTEKLADNSASPKELDFEFACLTSIKSDYRQRPPALMPGTVLEQTRLVNKKKRKVYWLCIQPTCDCVRLTEKRSFPFLELEPSDDKFDLALPIKERTYVAVRTVFSPFRSIMQEFGPSDDGSQVVRSVNIQGDLYFLATNKKRYKWIAELKFEHAQRIVNRYAATLSRVGLNESEWLRRWSA